MFEKELEQIKQAAGNSVNTAGSSLLQSFLQDNGVVLQPVSKPPPTMAGPFTAIDKKKIVTYLAVGAALFLVYKKFGKKGRV